MNNNDNNSSSEKFLQKVYQLIKFQAKENLKYRLLDHIHHRFENISANKIHDLLNKLCDE